MNASHCKSKEKFWKILINKETSFILFYFINLTFFIENMSRDNELGNWKKELMKLNSTTRESGGK